MLRKLLTSAAVLGLLTVGTASATSLGMTASPTLAAQVVELNGCTAPNAQVAFTQQFEGHYGRNGGSPAARLQNVKVTGFDADCEGRLVEAKLFDKDADGPGKGDFLGGYLSGTITQGAVDLPVSLNDRIDPEDVDGISIVVKDAS